MAQRWSSQLHQSQVQLVLKTACEYGGSTLRSLSGETVNAPPWWGTKRPGWVGVWVGVEGRTTRSPRGWKQGVWHTPRHSQMHVRARPTRVTPSKSLQVASGAHSAPQVPRLAAANQADQADQAD